MGFFFEGLEEHEGYVAAVLPDGVEGSQIWEAYDGSGPAEPVAEHLVAACTCGWRGAGRYTVDDVGAEDAQGEWEQRHIAPLAHRTPPRQLAAEIEAVRRQLADLAEQHPLQALPLLRGVAGWAEQYTRTAVREARAEGRSWSDIGTQLGVSKQAAHQRYGAADLGAVEDDIAGISRSITRAAQCYDGALGDHEA